MLSSSRRLIHAFRRQAISPGFSLIELTIVLVVIGALIALAVPSMRSTAVAEGSFVDQFAAALRYAQRYAVATGCSVQVSISAADNQFALKRKAGGTSTSCGNGAFTVDLTQPGQNAAYTVKADASVDVTSDFAVEFDAQGIPSTLGSIVIGGRTLTVESGTGYVH